jgi:hypothetical protein
MNSQKIVAHSVSVEVGGTKIPISIFADGPYEPTTTKPLVLIIYGGGEKFTQDELGLMKTAFVDRGMLAAGFNFRGHIAGNHLTFFDTGLHTRVEDARAVLNLLAQIYPYAPISVVAVSMGSYVSTFLDTNKIKNLILLGPAAYQPGAVAKKLNFNPKGAEVAPFRELIKPEGSWADSDGFSNIRSFVKSSLLVVRFERDDVIPRRIPELYLENHPGTRPKQLINLNFPHDGNFIKKEKVRALVYTASHWIESHP